jgi:serine/threonine protein kinase
VLSIQMLHRKEIVHGDLKPTNVLIQRVSGGSLHTAKLIDFDDSYLSGSPPPRQQIVGDSAYGAPEWFGYTKNDDRIAPHMLTKAADIFALGLIFHQYLAKAMPAFDRRFTALGEAVAAGEWVTYDKELSPGLVKLLDSMLAPQPGNRPSIGQVFDELRNEDLLALGARPSTGSRVRTNTGRTGPVPTVLPAVTPARTPPAGAPAPSRVRINFNPKES